MIQRIHSDMTLQRQMKALRKAGGRRTRAAEHAEAIIRKLVTGSGDRPEQIGRTTRHGEMRIKKCIKYDLTEGFRLIGVIETGEVIFLFIGDHDECDRWLTKNSGLRSIPKKTGNDVLSVQEAAVKSPSAHAECELEQSDEYENLLEGLDEKDLRKIFCGLTGG